MDFNSVRLKYTTNTQMDIWKVLSRKSAALVLYKTPPGAFRSYNGVWTAYRGITNNKPVLIRRRDGISGKSLPRLDMTQLCKASDSSPPANPLIASHEA